MSPKIIRSMMINIAIFLIISVFHYFVAMYGIWALVGGNPLILVIFTFASIAVLKYVEKKKVKPDFDLSKSENAAIGFGLLAFVIFLAPAAYSDPNRTKRLVLLSIFEVLLFASTAYYYVRYLKVTRRTS